LALALARRDRDSDAAKVIISNVSLRSREPNNRFGFEVRARISARRICVDARNTHARHTQLKIASQNVGIFPQLEHARRVHKLVRAHSTSRPR
jgi:hypothetical protein